MHSRMGVRRRVLQRRTWHPAGQHGAAGDPALSDGNDHIPLIHTHASTYRCCS